MIVRWNWWAKIVARVKLVMCAQIPQKKPKSKVTQKYRIHHWARARTAPQPKPRAISEGRLRESGGVDTNHLTPSARPGEWGVEGELTLDVARGFSTVPGEEILLIQSPIFMHGLTNRPHEPI